MPDPTAPQTRSDCLEIRTVGKTFPGVRALRDVSLTVRSGQVHGLLGANGAGKSTLIKILNGVYPHGSYEGEFRLHGEVAEFRSPHDALRHGLGYVPQELSVIDTLTVAENLYVGNLNASGGVLVSPGRLRKRATELLRRWSIPLHAGDPVSRLRASERQLVMIARALAAEPTVLVLDEPTSSLTRDETTRLFDILRTLRAAGVTIILITHRMPEIFEMCDAATVLRDGVAVATYDRADFDEAQLVEDMVGRRLEAMFPDRANRSLGSVALAAEGLTVRHPFAVDKNVVSDVTLSVRHGEILGIAGLMGAGRSELLNALYGRLPYTGTVICEGLQVKLSSPRDAKRAGIAYLGEDRKGEGLLFNLDVGRNITIGSLERVSGGGLLHPRAERGAVAEFMTKLNIKAPGASSMVSTLSGGNQQKVILARVLMTEPKVVLLDEPTKGVDVGAKQQIYRLIADLADEGVAVIMVSSEFDELIGLCDRILVLAEGHITAERPGKAASEAELVAAASGSVPAAT